MAYGSLVPVFSLAVADALPVQLGGNPASSIAMDDAEIKDLPYHHRFLRINCSFRYFFIPLIQSPGCYQSISVWYAASAIAAVQNQLPQALFGTHRGLSAFPVSLPKSDIVEQRVDVVVEPLLALFDAPNTNSMPHKPLYNKRAFIRFAANAVEHEHKQNIKFSLKRVFFDPLQNIPVFFTYQEPGYAGFLAFVKDFPSHLPGKFPASISLHRNISLIFRLEVRLLSRGYTI